MATSLRAFLMMKIDDEWKISVHRELEDVLAAWKDRADAAESAGVVHLGFERPAARLFDDLIELYPGQVLLTASARFGLPMGFEASDGLIEVVGDLPIYLATRGWGYLVDPSTIATKNDRFKPALERKSYGWVSEFLTHHQDSASDFAAADIFDDADYLARENTLSWTLRKAAGVYRLRLLIQDHEDDPCSFASAAPPWLAERKVETINFRSRVANVLTVLKIQKVTDLANFTVTKLTGTQNFGRKSISDLLDGLEAALQQGPIQQGTHTPSGLLYQEQASLLESITLSLSRLPDRAREIVERRMGFGHSQQTLQQVGEQFGVTRERVRQIEAKTIARLVHDEIWDDVLTDKLNRLLSSRPSPLPLRGIDAADPWFKGVGENAEVLRYLLQNMSGAGQIVTVEGVEYLTRLSQTDWEEIVSNSKSFLESSSDRSLTKEQCKAAVLANLPDAAREFSDLLWDVATRHSHFVQVEQEEILVGHGRGAERIVHAILSESPTPLHYTQIDEISRSQSDRGYDIRRIHNAAANVGYLFNRGTYGLDRHLPFTVDELTAISDAAEEIVEEGPADRQWHANEILADLIESGLAHLEALSKYTLDIALKKSGNLEDLGRMVWRKASQSAQDNAFRIDIRQAVIAVLRDAGGPLKAQEIRLRVQEMRGVDKLFQLHIADPIVRLGPALYGLNDRDISLKKDQQGAVLDSMVRWLESREKGVHYSELEEIPQLHHLGINAATLFSLASNDVRMRANTGRYLYLSEWEGPRRESLTQAVKRVMETGGRPLAMDDILVRVSTDLGRTVERTTVVSSLGAIDAQYSEILQKWHLPSKTGQEVLP